MKLFYYTCFIIALTACTKTSTQLTKITAKTIAIDSMIPPSSEVDRVILPFKEKLASEMQEVLCYTTTDLLKSDGVMQSSLGNLMADMCFEVADSIFKRKEGKSIDFAMFNHGGIRTTIGKGAITTETIFQLMPFENELVVVKMSGQQIAALVKYFIDGKKAHPLSKQLAIKIHNDDSYELMIHGNSFDKNKSYYVLTSDYLQNGGDQMHFFQNPEELIPLDYKFRDALIATFKKADTLQAVIDQRIRMQ